MHTDAQAAACTEETGLSYFSVRYIPTALNTNAREAGRKTETASIGRLRCEYSPTAAGSAAQERAPATRTGLERVTIPASDQNDSALREAESKRIAGAKSETCPANNTVPTSKISRNGMGAKDIPLPIPKV